MPARLLLAFFAITGFAVLAAAAGIYAFREVGGRLDFVDTRIPPTLSALELSRSAERIIAAAPALLAATDRNRRDETKAALIAEVNRLNTTLVELKGNDAAFPSLLKIEPIVSSLTADLAALEVLVARRLETSERIGALRRSVFRTNEETQRLLSPWLEVTESEIAALVKAREAGPTDLGAQPARLASLIELQRLMRSAQMRVSDVADMLADASTADQSRRLDVLDFQLGLALRDLEATAAKLDAKLRPLFLEQVAKLRELAERPSAIAQARKQELALLEDGEKRLTQTNSLSAELTAAVDQLGSAAKRDIGEAIREVLSVQRLSIHALLVVVVTSLVTSFLIAWLYVGRNIVRRLTALSDGTLAIAEGRLHTPIAMEGADEIAAMGRAVEIFRQNTLERDELLAEKAQAAERLEREVEQRTAELEEKSRQLEIANRYKAHFLASASHDLRQPLHALNLFIAQLRTETDGVQRERLIGRVDAAIGSMNELFEALLDMSKLEAGILEPSVTEFPVERLLKRIETTFADAAREKGLRLAVVPSSAWVRSDFVLLERILFNLISNAMRYTARGGVVVGAHHRGGQLRIDVCDTGPGIPEEEQRNVFGEFYQLAESVYQLAESDRRGGLGLGLAIVDRLGRLLGHPIELRSRPGRGSRFSVLVPPATAVGDAAESPVAPAIIDPAQGKLVLVIDDDPLVIDGMGGILRGWGCEVLQADSEETALSSAAAQGQRPDLIIADYRLADGKTGIQAIQRLRGAVGAQIPAFLISGDTAPERLRDAREKGFHLLHKPVAPMRLRAMLNQLLRAGDATQAAE